MFDTPAVVAILPGESLQGTHVSGQSLRVQCVDGRLSAAVQWEAPTAQALTAEDSPEIEVLIRWGTDTPVWERWRRAGHEPVSESGNPSEFIERLTDHRALAVRTYPSQDRPVTLAFDLRGRDTPSRRKSWPLAKHSPKRWGNWEAFEPSRRQEGTPRPSES